MKKWMMVWITAVLLGVVLALQMGGLLGLYLWGRWLVGAAVTMGLLWAWMTFCYNPGGPGEEPPPMPGLPTEEPENKETEQ